MSLVQRNFQSSRLSDKSGKSSQQSKQSDTSAKEKPGKKKILFFTDSEEGSEINTFGLKGAALSELSRLNLPVPEGFAISMQYAKESYDDSVLATMNEKKRFKQRYEAAIEELEKRCNAKFGDVQDGAKKGSGSGESTTSPRGGETGEKGKLNLPLLVSVRASVAYDLPGAAETILNIGLSDHLVSRLAQDSQFNPRWVYDSYRRLLQSFGTIVYGVEEKKYRIIVKTALLRAGVFEESMFTVADLLQIITEFKRLSTLPEDPWEQLELAINGIYKSWYSNTAEKYKQIQGIPPSAGVAIVVQQMVAGNLNARSGVGVAFSRNPNNGRPEYVAEYLSCANGSDILAGTVDVKTMANIRDEQPGLYYNLVHVLKLLERKYKDMQEIEFTVQDGMLFLLNAMSAKRSARASVVSIVNMQSDGLITEKEAITRIDPLHMMHYLRPHLVPSYQFPKDVEVMNHIVTRGMAASFGVAYGKIVMTVQDALEAKEKGIPCILCKPELTSEDIEGLQAASGAVCSRGSFASHAAIWLREAGKPAIIAARDLAIEITSRFIVSTETGLRLVEGDYITIDGASGYIFIGEAPTLSTKPDDDFYTVMGWAKSNRVQNILCTVENAAEVTQAIQFGADGIGLLKTENLFFGPDTIELTRFIILTDSITEKAGAIAQLMEIQMNELLTIFRAVGDRDVVVRLVNVSHNQALAALKTGIVHDALMALATRMNLQALDVLHKIDSLYEMNPALGIRGLQASMLYPELTTMQVRAITGATLAARKEGIQIRTKILLPTMSLDSEIDRVLPLVKEAIAETCAQKVTTVDFKDVGLEIGLGISISVPRACLLSDRLTAFNEVTFMTIETDELTQLVFGSDQLLSDKVMNYYANRNMISRNPFISLDVQGVGHLVREAICKTRVDRDDIPVNIYGKQAVDPASIRFFDQIGVDTLTVPHNYYIPVAAIASARSNVGIDQGISARYFKPFAAVNKEW